MQENSPIVVSGVPRSGTTWVASILGHGARTSLLAREPMNPRSGGFHLAGLAQDWLSLDHEVPAGVTRQWRRVLRGLEPRLWGRRGRKQPLAALPGVRIIVKDPFATLSLAYLRREFDAITVAVFRPPEAMLASRRRMGWKTDWRGLTRALGRKVERAPKSDVEAVAVFWTAAYQHILDIPSDLAPILVSHPDLANGGVRVADNVLTAVGLRTTAHTQRQLDAEFSGGSEAAPPPGTLHMKGRDPSSTTEQWRERVSDDERAQLRDLTGDVHDELMARWTAQMGCCTDR